MYPCRLGLGGSYGNNFKNIKLQEILQYGECVVKDVAHIVSGGDIYRLWING